jgi:MSHA biogenesis protein MshO
MKPHESERGFTIIELIMVIVIMGVIGGMVAVFMKSPIDAYFDSARRAALTDVADTTVRRMARDIRKALPNSVRLCPVGINGVMFIPTKTGGRYRTVDAAVGDGGTALNFAAEDASFNMLGDNRVLPADQQIAPGDVIAVYNLGISDADAYAGNNTAIVSGVVPGVETTIVLNPGMKFPLASGSNRFHVIPAAEKVVSYVCTGGQLRRKASTTFDSTCPATGAVLADHVNCSFVYNGSDLQRNALVQISLKFTDGSGEYVSLYQEVHVDNTP